MEHKSLLFTTNVQYDTTFIIIRTYPSHILILQHTQYPHEATIRILQHPPLHFPFSLPFDLATSSSLSPFLTSLRPPRYHEYHIFLSLFLLPIPPRSLADAREASTAISETISIVIVNYFFIQLYLSRC